mmetsp:Transcript_35718/g.81941  ORF Transcript_35718/g.81941 Transcript_35718/m.81941 type:complete len:342 (+) Transcript_35718:67-1092(+)
MASDMLASLDGVAARLVAGFLEPETLCRAFLQTSRLMCSAAICQSQACRSKLHEWRTQSIAKMFEQDKRLSRAVSWVECMILVRHGDAVLEEGVAADRFEGMALRSQMVAALERAVAAAAQHAEKCAEVNATLLNQAHQLSRLLSWLKLQHRLYRQEVNGTQKQHAAIRLESCRLEALELRHRLSFLLRASETFVTLVAGCGGAFERHQRLIKVVRLAQLARPDGLGSGVEEECDRIHEAWTHAARRLDAVVCSLHMRCEVFAQVALGWGFRGLGVASCLDSALAHGGHLRSGSSHCRASASEPSVAKLNILNAIAASTTLSGVGFAAWEMSQSCQEGLIA